jgi:hypothetical protein
VKQALLLLCLAAFAHAEERAFLETETPRTTYYVHEPLRLTLRIGFDRRFFETNVVQMFSRELDVPVQVHAPWLEALEGAIPRNTLARDGRRLSVALNDDVVGAERGEDRLRNGTPYTVLEIVRTYLPTRPGELVLTAPRLRFVHATKFKEDFVHGRIALDRVDALVVGAPLKLRVLALPEEERPPEFTGAVGRRFSVRAEASPRTLEVGAIAKLVLHVEGEGNLELFDPPRLDGLTGRFHVYGLIDDRGATRRMITYDIAPLVASVTEVPAIPFTYFDPQEPAAYRTVATAPVPLAVTGGAPLPPAETRRSPAVLVVALLLVVALAVLLWLYARRRSAPAPDAAAVFRAQVGTDAAAAFTGYLASRLGCPAAAVIAPDLTARLEAAGVPEALAARAAMLLEELVAARYGGAASDGRTEANAWSLVEELEASFVRLA